MPVPSVEKEVRSFVEQIGWGVFFAKLAGIPISCVTAIFLVPAL